MGAAAARVALEARRDEVRAELDRITAAPRDPVAAVSFGKRVGDGTTEAVERLNRVAAAEGLVAMLADIDRAIVKIDEGSYGRCDRCGNPIPPERLEARPWAVRCVRCAAR
jgi:DnaK suppressor protein